MENIETKNDYLTEKEVRAELEELGTPDLIRLSRVAKRFAGRGFSGEDLIQEAVLLILEGTRKWKRGMRAAPFIYSTMKSIADAKYKKKSVENATKASKDQTSGERILKSAGLTPPSPEDYCIRKETEEETDRKNSEMHQKIFDLFKDDDVATMILMGLEEGLQPEEICKVAEITRTQYNSARRRIRRTVDQNHA